MSLEAELTFQAFENDTKLPRYDNKEIHTGERKKKISWFLIKIRIKLKTTRNGL